ncbi:MAG: MBL fold metallo-hydrolase [Anaerolineae bacterium]|nr:MBL fold metallo-hydrolase [Anaerolineae bacterium]
MDITWYGHACFRLKSRDATVITDPYDKTLGLSLPSLKADIVTVSHNTPHHNHTAGVKGNFKVIDHPGEYEISGVFVTGIRMLPRNAKAAESNNVFVIYLDDIALCHLGDLAHVPTQKQVEEMGSIDVLLVPVGGQNALKATQAAEVISLIEPYIVIPMHYKLPNITLKLDPVSKFLKEMGIAKTETIDTLKLTRTNLPEETQVILLEAKA